MTRKKKAREKKPPILIRMPGIPVGCPRDIVVDDYELVRPARRPRRKAK